MSVTASRRSLLCGVATLPMLTCGAVASAAAPDPIFAAIAEGRRLVKLSDEAYAIPQDPMTIDPPEEREAAQEALFEHCDEVLSTIVPTTGAGCVALAQFALDFEANQGVPLDDRDGGAPTILVRIALSPALTASVVG